MEGCWLPCCVADSEVAVVGFGWVWVFDGLGVEHSLCCSGTGCGDIYTSGMDSRAFEMGTEDPELLDSEPDSDVAIARLSMG